MDTIQLVDKYIKIHGQNLDIKVDYDDVDHATVKSEVEKMVRILNTYWNHQPILLYRFDDAPTELQRLSCRGGDEDWMIVVDENVDDDAAFHALIASPFFSSVEPPQREKLPDGRVVYITTHA